MADTRPPALPVDVATLPAAGRTVTVSADAAARDWLAGEADLIAVERFDAALVFRRWRRDGVAVTGDLSAAIVQPCAVSLEPMENTIAETVERLFLPEGSKLARPRYSDDGELVIDPDGPEPPELYSGTTLDVWQILREHFLLAIDPFARLSDGIAAQPAAGKADDEEAESPFAVLRSLKTRSEH